MTTRTRKQNARRSKRKGSTWEREVARRVREEFGLSEEECKRGLGQARAAGEVADVDGVPGWWLECKHMKLCNLRAALRQAVKAVPDDRVPVAICKDDPSGVGERAEVFAVLRFDDWLKLVAKTMPKAPCYGTVTNFEPVEVEVECPPACRSVSGQVNHSYCPRCREKGLGQ